MKRLAAALVLGAAIGWGAWPHQSSPKPDPISNRGQLLAAARAYATIQADSNGVTVLNEHVVSVKKLEDGKVAAVVHMVVQGVNHKGSMDLLVVMKDSLWRGVASSVLRTRVTG